MKYLAVCVPTLFPLKLLLTGTALTIMMDLICVLLPILVYRKLQISWRDKLAVFVLLGLGLLSVLPGFDTSPTSLTLCSTAGAAIARTLLYKFKSNNPTCKYNFHPASRVRIKTSDYLLGDIIPDAIWAS